VAITLAAVLAVLVVACTAPVAVDDDQTAQTAWPVDPHATAVPSSTGWPVEDLGGDLRPLTFAPGEPVDVTIGADDRSWALAVVADDPADLVGIRRVVDPTGAVRYAADLRNEVLLVDELHPRVLADAGAVGLYVTGEEGRPLTPGTWQVEVVGNDADPTVRVVVRTGSTDGPQVLDVAVWATAPDVDPAAVAQRWRTVADDVMAPHGLAIGELVVTPAGTEGSAWRTLGLDALASDVHAACERAAVATGAGPRTALVVLVDRIGEGVLTAAGPDAMAVRRPDGEIDGFAVATPGTPVLGPASHACVAVAARGDAPARGPVALHEVLHLAGLTRHTTERAGRDFDRLADTPECPAGQFDLDGDQQVSRIECAERDAGNLMFWAAGGVDVSAAQAWRVRQHPLLHQAAR
jgi:hypothetical protein